MQALRSVLSKCFADNYLTNTHNVVMLAQHEGIYFAKSGDGESIFLLIKFQLLQGDNVACLFISSAKNDAIRTLFYGVELFIRVHGTRRCEGRVTGSWWDEYALRRSLWRCVQRRRAVGVLHHLAAF